MREVENIAIIGAGALGSFYASKLYEMHPEAVSLIAKGDRYRALEREGLVINGKPYSFRLMDPNGNPSPPDLIIIAVKHHHLPQAIMDIKNLVGDETQILSVMNGIDSEEQIAATYGMDRVIYGVALGIDAVRQGNRITYSKERTLFFGEAKNTPPADRIMAVKGLFDRAGIVCEIPEDMIRVLWWKFMINVGVNQMSAVLRAPYGVFQRVKEAAELMEAAMQEVMALSEAAGVDLRKEDIEDWYEIMSGLSPTGKTSMLQDVEAGRKTEVEMFAGRVIKLGQKYDIPTHVNDLIFKIIKVFENSAAQIPKGS
ncbi:MAG: 2-dehydropantoate 2-reductase [Deltaproteobacteria bacterium]|nr:MAG: 2-dehydropantoate 2-reductase [Deltaproteobacteria bacterium]